MKPQQWSLELAGKQYEILFTLDRWRGRHKLVVNGEPVSLSMDFKARYLGVIDVPFDLGDLQARLVVTNGKKADIAIHGMYIDSQRSYVPIKIPAWSWLFVFLMIGIPVISLGGAIPGALGAVGALLCVRFSVHPTWSVVMKWSVCSLCVVLFYVILFGFQMIILGMR